MKRINNDEVSVGDVVLVHAEGKCRVTWPLGRVSRSDSRKGQSNKTY